MYNPPSLNSTYIDTLKCFLIFPCFLYKLFSPLFLHSLSQMPCLEQTSAIMILHLFLSSVIRSNAMLSLLFPITKELKLSRNVILCLPLLLVPSILPVRDKNSSPLWRHMCPKNFSCLFLIVFIRDLSWFVSSNIDSFVLFLAMIFLTFSCRTTFPLPLHNFPLLHYCTVHLCLVRHISTYQYGNRDRLCLDETVSK